MNRPRHIISIVGTRLYIEIGYWENHLTCASTNTNVQDIYITLMNHQLITHRFTRYYLPVRHIHTILTTRWCVVLLGPAASTAETIPASPNGSITAIEVY